MGQTGREPFGSLWVVTNSCVLGHCCKEAAAPDLTVLQLSGLPRRVQDAPAAQRQLPVPLPPQMRGG